MRGESHIRLGLFLADHYLKGAPVLCRRAFLLGCIQPDRNPASYLKGSLRCRWFRGHNFENAEPAIARFVRRLCKKDALGLWDYYTAGKLIHYTADAFTYAHNAAFSGSLKMHLAYETDLQHCFLSFLEASPGIPQAVSLPLWDLIPAWHWEYLRQGPGVDCDCRFIFSVCCQMTEGLFSRSHLQNMKRCHFLRA